MHKNILFGLAFGIAICGSTGSSAQNNAWSSHGESQQWETLTQNERTMVDRMAADFYESDLRLAQSRQIEASTAATYSSMSDRERAEFREERREAWETMHDEERKALRNVKLPDYSNLTDAQKAPFRQIAIDRLAPHSNSQTTPHSGAGSSNDI